MKRAVLSLVLFAVAAPALAAEPKPKEPTAAEMKAQIAQLTEENARLEALARVLKMQRDQANDDSAHLAAQMIAKAH